MDTVELNGSSALDEPRKSLLENCSLCDTPLHQSRAPQLFPCLHSACSTCLSKQHKEENKKSMECPSCKRLFGITEIMDNVIFKLSRPPSGKSDNVMKKCGGCEDLAISGWCKDCEEFLCSDCVSAHIRVKLTRNHTVVAQELSTGSHPTLCCQSHVGKSLKFFCVDCDVLTCRSCLSVEHRKHSYQMLSEAVSASKEKLHSLEGAVTKQKDQVKQSLLDVNQRLQNIIDLKARLKNMLCWKVFKVYQVMLRKALQLFQYAQGVYGTEEEQLSQQKAALEEIVERQNYIMSFIDKTLSSKGQAVVLLKNRIESQINDLLCQSVPPTQCMFEIKLQVDATLMSKVENFGRVSVKLVPSAHDQAVQSESMPERDPKLQNVPSDRINKGTSATSPDSSTQGALLSRSPVVPTCDRSRSHNNQLPSLPSSSPQGSSYHTQNAHSKCITNAATSTTSPDVCAQAAHRGQSPTVSSSDSSQFQLNSSGGVQPCQDYLLQSRTHVDGPKLSVPTESSHPHQDRPNEFLSRLRNVVKVSAPHTNRVKIKDEHRVQVDIIDLTCDDAVSTAETKTAIPLEGRDQVDLAPSADLGLPHSLFKVNTNGSQDIIPPHKIKEEHLAESSVCCEVCDLGEGTLFCVECGKTFHRSCHVPPITTQFVLHKWKCSLCQDFSDPTDPFKGDRPRKLCLSSLDQRRCEYLILALLCKKTSCILYLCNKKATSMPVDFDFIHERLLRKRSPPYRTPSELVSDVWVLLESLQSRTENIDDVLEMQKSFERRVNQVFGDTLHPSLLTRPNMKRGSEDLDKAGGQIKRETLKGENSSEDYTGPVFKKPHLC